MALNFGLLDQGGPTNFFEGYSQGQEKMQANAMAQQRAAQAQQEFGMRQQEFAAGQADKQRVAKAAVVTQKTASARDALLRAPTAADARRIVEMQYADPDLGPIRGRFGSLVQALAEIPEEASAFQQYKEQEAMGMEAFLKQQAGNRAFTTAMGGAPQANAMGAAPTNAMVAPAISGELQNFISQRGRLAMLAEQSPQVKATIDRLDKDIARLVEEQKPEPGFNMSPGQIRYPRGYMGAGVISAPAAAQAAAVPPSVAEYQFAKTADGGSFVGSYQDFVKAKADASRAPTPVAAPQALPASVQEYEYAKTENGGSFVGTYQDFVKAKADAARAPAPVVAPQAQPASVLEYNFAKTPDGGGFVGTYQDFVQSKAEAGRAPVPITAPPAKVAEYEYAKTPAGGSYKGTYQQFLNLGKSEGGTADRAPRTQQVTLNDGTLGIVNMDTGVITRSTVGGASVKGKPSAFAEKAAAQKVQMGKDLTQAITELTDATKDGGLIDQSTGSGAGRLVDLAAGFGGKAMPGAIAIGKLQPIADIALKMVPRFEGPQSDRDTTSYKQAAGQLADPTLPTKIRKEAGKTVLRLMKARKEQFGTVDMVAEGVAPAPAAAAPNIDALLNKYK